MDNYDSIFCLYFLIIFMFCLFFFVFFFWLIKEKIFYEVLWVLMMFLYLTDNKFCFLIVNLMLSFVMFCIVFIIFMNMEMEEEFIEMLNGMNFF